MAEITKPMALDESLNTTELSPRNIADVLAQGIGDLVTVVSRISHQTVYDELSDLEDVNISAPTNGDVLTYDGSKWTNGQVGGGSAEQMIAPVETSTTASRSYAIGEQFILNGTLYTATAAITAGGTIVIDGNCTASDTVTEQIEKKTPWINLSATPVSVDESHAGSSSGTLYTTTGDCWARFVIQRKSGTGVGRMFADGVYIGAIGTGDVQLQLWVPLRKGTVITYSVDSGTTCRFYLAIMYN